MTVHDAQPGDIYTDANNKLWRVIGYCEEPSVIVQEIEPSLPLDGKAQKRGGVSGLMWAGFKRIFRPSDQ